MSGYGANPGPVPPAGGGWVPGAANGGGPNGYAPANGGAVHGANGHYGAVSGAAAGTSAANYGAGAPSGAAAQAAWGQYGMPGTTLAPAMPRPAQVWHAYGTRGAYSGAPYSAPKSPNQLGVLEFAVLLVSAIAMVASILLTTSSAEITTSVPFLAAVAALPLMAVLGVVRWIDRWEPEPMASLVMTFLWGAGLATLIAALANTAAFERVYNLTGSPEQGDLFASVVSAPFVEEGAKAFVLLLLLWYRPHAIGGPVDGVVYAATTAAGFAFVENIAYFFRYSYDLTGIFIVRGVFSPFAHLIFTAMTGLALGFAARSANRRAWILLAPVGYLAAVLLHALWNGAAMAGHNVSFWIQVPGLIFLFFALATMQRAELSLVQWHLEPYVRSGQLERWEQSMVTVPQAHRTAIRWAKQRRKSKALKDFQSAAVQLALARHRAATRSSLEFPAQERRYMERMVDARLRLRS
ncbi:MAG: PrsW family intramembrane metalloprotease [Buchananella hordeovulneris]|nr:PrsW family intramembrane metalloprotease [Buchananella hordeovulneris]